MKKISTIILSGIAAVSSVLAENESNFMTGSVVVDTTSTGSKSVLTGAIIVLGIIFLWLIVRKIRRR